MKTPFTLAAATAAATAALALSLPAAAQPHAGRMADTDGDGNVTIAEVNAHVAKRFAAADANNDGGITKAEMQTEFEQRAAAWKERRQDSDRPRREISPERRERMMAFMFSRSDTNGDGQITLAEMEEKALERFARLDTNGDGRIDAAEREAAKDARKDRRGKHRSR